MKIHLFKELFMAIKMNEEDSYCIDKLLEAYHFGKLEYLSLAKEKINSSNNKNKEYIMEIINKV
jgi:stalled ribosome rescue protein Dom34